MKGGLEMASYRFILYPIFIVFILGGINLGVSHATTPTPAWTFRVDQAAKFGVSMPLADSPLAGTQASETLEEESDELISGGVEETPHSDPVVQRTPGAALNINVRVNTPGIISTMITPDSTGAVGLFQYMQVTNDRLAVFSKATGELIHGPLRLASPWSGFGGQCEHGKGDGVVVYDQLADRWVITGIFVEEGTIPTGESFRTCYAVSTSPDALGTYFLYEFPIGERTDYPRLSVWPDAYYVAEVLAFGTGRSRVCALDRARMLAGNHTPEQHYFTINGTEHKHLIPADLDGRRVPTAGTPNVFVNIHQVLTKLEIWKFFANFEPGEVSSLVGPTDIVTEDFQFACNLRATNGCARQPPVILPPPLPPVKQKLWALSRRLMPRASYRVFPTHDALVVNHAVDPLLSDSNDPDSGPQVGIRWYEIHDPTGSQSRYSSAKYLRAG